MAEPVSPATGADHDDIDGLAREIAMVVREHVREAKGSCPRGDEVPPLPHAAQRARPAPGRVAANSPEPPAARLP